MAEHRRAPDCIGMILILHPSTAKISEWMACAAAVALFFKDFLTDRFSKGTFRSEV